MSRTVADVSYPDFKYLTLVTVTGRQPLYETSATVRDSNTPVTVKGRQSLAYSFMSSVILKGKNYHRINPDHIFFTPINAHMRGEVRKVDRSMEVFLPVL